MALTGTNAYGAELFYVPAATELTLDAGSRATIPLTIGLTNGGLSDYRLFFLNTITGGNLPLDWLQAFPSLSFLSNDIPSDSTTVTIGVPSQTPSGTYTGRIVAMAAGPQGPVNSGDGMLLSVRVSNPCGRIPDIEIASFGPDKTRSNGRQNTVLSVSGKISMPNGCTLYVARFQMEDEYGRYSGQGGISVDRDNRFVLRIPIGISQKRSDTDGRSYTVHLYAENELGGTHFDLTAHVPRNYKK